MKLFCAVLLLLSSCSKVDKGFVPDFETSANQKNEDSLITYGKELILHTSKYFGPKGIISQTSNGMNCTNCHLEAGTVYYGNNYAAVFPNYPKFRERSGMVEDLKKRINDCFQRSLNGKPLAGESPEIQAMVSYINSVGKEVPKNTVPEGSGIKKLKFMNRAANPEIGKIVYEKNCIQCHGSQGEGKLESGVNGDYFEYPSLWGENSYNVSAGLNRIQNLAGFIHDNMPNKVATYQNPTLSEEEAWDVAAFIISKPRPQKFFREDWPNLKTKPIDYAFGPFADPFSEEQHRYGPFQPVVDFRKKN